MKRVLLLAATTGYQTRMFGEAARRLGLTPVFATDRCDQLDDPWWDGAIPIRFHQETQSLDAILAAAELAPLDGILALGDRPTVIAARAAARLGLPGHPVEAAEAARDKRLTRATLRAAGLPAPWSKNVLCSIDPRWLLGDLEFPLVVKPASLSGSRGVIRADDPQSFLAAFARLQALLSSTDVQALRDPASDAIIVEQFIEGHEYAVEAILDHGTLHALAIFDKPDPLDGPFFEETIYVTPPPLEAAEQARILDAVSAAARALGLQHGPLHAECRVHPDRRVHVLEVAARPIGGLCANALEFVDASGTRASLEELLLRHALGEPVAPWSREPAASGVMMIPIAKAGYLRGWDGEDRARLVEGVCDVRITAKPDQLLVPLPEGASYLGFIFAKAASAEAVEEALRGAHARLSFVIERQPPILKAPLAPAPAPAPRT